jgi:hypothetical protein
MKINSTKFEIVFSNETKSIRTLRLIQKKFPENRFCFRAAENGSYFIGAYFTNINQRNYLTGIIKGVYSTM